jgi:hypothetical protein
VEIQPVAVAPNILQRAAKFETAIEAHVHG